MKMHKFFKSVYIILIAIKIVCELSRAVDASSVLFQSGESKYSPKYFDNFSMSIVNNSLSLDMTTKKLFTRGFKVHVDFSISLGSTRNYQSVFTHVMDTCGVVSAVKSNIFKGWFKTMLQHGNFMYNCPVPAGHYFLRDWKLDGSLVPQYLYTGNYRVTGHFFYGKFKTSQEDFVLDMSVFALLKAK